MSEGYVPFNAAKQTAQVLAGLKGGPFNAPQALAPKMTFVEGYPAEVNESLQVAKTKSMTPLDPWVYRRPNKTMK